MTDSIWAEISVNHINGSLDLVVHGRSKLFRWKKTYSEQQRKKDIERLIKDLREELE